MRSLLRVKAQKKQKKTLRNKLLRLVKERLAKRRLPMRNQQMRNLQVRSPLKRRLLVTKKTKMMLQRVKE